MLTSSSPGEGQGKLQSLEEINQAQELLENKVFLVQILENGEWEKVSLGLQ